MRFVTFTLVTACCLGLSGCFAQPAQSEDETLTRLTAIERQVWEQQSAAVEQKKTLEEAGEPVPAELQQLIDELTAVRAAVEDSMGTLDDARQIRSNIEVGEYDLMTLLLVGAAGFLLPSPIAGSLAAAFAAYKANRAGPSAPAQ